MWRLVAMALVCFASAAVIAAVLIIERRQEAKSDD